MLTDAEIQNLVQTVNLINPFNAGGLRHCRYNLRADRVFSPETGSEQVINEVREGERRSVWIIKPTETVVVMTRERIRMPQNLVGAYGQLYRWARVGLFLGDLSIVEPAYEGPLSCVLVNYSKREIALKPGDEIAKLTFERLTSTPAKITPEVISNDDYAKTLAESASYYPRSFMDIAGTEDRITENVGRQVTNSFKWGGIIIGALILFAAVEPPLSSWVWDRYGLVSPRSDRQMEQIKTDFDSTRNQLQALQNNISRDAATKLERQIQVQAKEIQALQQQTKH